MSRENAEIVRRALGATNTQEMDWETINAVYHPDHVFVPATSALGDGQVKGASGAREWMEMQKSVTAWDSEVHGIVEMGPNVVLAKVRLNFRGVSSGARGEQDMWLVLELRGGKITQTLSFVTPHEAAHEAARLSQ